MFSNACIAISCLVLRLVTLAASEILYFDFNITWVLSNPDGRFPRPTIGVNNQWPPPQLEANVGDTIVVNVLNLLGNQSTSLHFHGISMRGTTHMDGPSQVTQCPILPGQTFQYMFQVTDPGTYWYHSHDRAQYPDGLRGLLVVHDPISPYKDQYHEEIVLSISDWYHEQMPDLLARYLDKNNTMAVEPIPDSNLLNDTHDIRLDLVPGKIYLVRVANIGAFMGQYFRIADHELVIIEVDGVYTKPTSAQVLYLSTGQRYSFLMTAKNHSTTPYGIFVTMDSTLIMDDEKLGSDITVTGWIVYNSTVSIEKNIEDPIAVQPPNFFDDISLMPWDEEMLLDPPNRIITLDMGMHQGEDGAWFWDFNNISYNIPKVPTLYTALVAGQDALDDTIYGASTNTFVLHSNETVQLIINNQMMSRHPVHLHGHQFQVIYRSEDWAGPFVASKKIEENYPKSPMRRDTAVVNPGGSLVLRFKADNPGVWIFHCHMEWHAHSGLVATFVEAPLELQDILSIPTLPSNHLKTCNGTINSTLAGDALPIDDNRSDSKPSNNSVVYIAIYILLPGAVFVAVLAFLRPHLTPCAKDLWKTWHTRGFRYRIIGNNVSLETLS